MSRTLCLLFLFLVNYSNATCQSVVTVFFGINAYERNPCRQTGSSEETEDFQKRKDFFKHRLGDIVEPYSLGEINKDLYEKGVISLRFTDLENAYIFDLQEAGLTSVDVRAGEKEFSLRAEEIQASARCFDLNIPIQRIVDELRLLPYEEFKIQLHFHGVHQVAPGSDGRKFLFKGRMAPYSQVLDGGWMPISLFSSNFKPVEEGGIPFSSQPVGGAWGKKLYFNSQRKFLGVSAVGNWLIYPVSNPGQTDDDSFSLSGGSTGLLLDVGSWFYLGGAYGFDFESEKSDKPKLMGVVGLGPKFFALFKGE
ncbi:MAG: hypothetical protein GYB31_20985 [Bacteroidetes bacterium]|nr:hypothetical protein [Bacteroidota bacterium]